MLRALPRSGLAVAQLGGRLDAMLASAVGAERLPELQLALCSLQARANPMTHRRLDADSSPTPPAGAVVAVGGG